MDQNKDQTGLAGESKHSKLLEVSDIIQPEKSDILCNTDCDSCKLLKNQISDLEDSKLFIEKQLSSAQAKLEMTKKELEREAQRRCELEQRFAEEAKRSGDQIEELIAKSNQDDAKLSELRDKFNTYSRDTSSMIESFTTNREILTSQLLELRKENDLLLGKFIAKSHDLQDGEIDLPQNIEDLQFHCLTLNEKLILATLAKEQLEETMIQNPRF